LILIRKRNSCSAHHYFVVGLVMAGLKSFLYGVAPILGVTGAVLYERQRALVNLGVLTANPGRGPGSGVLLTAENVAAVIISLLAAGSLSEVDERVVALCSAPPDFQSRDGWKEEWWKELGKPTFRSEISRLLSGERIQWHGSSRSFRGIRVSRCWRGQILPGRAVRAIDFFVDGYDRDKASHLISITAEIEEEMLAKLIIYTQGALSQAAGLEEEDDE
jgi:hypothetical protein